MLKSRIVLAGAASLTLCLASDAEATSVGHFTFASGSWQVTQNSTVPAHQFTAPGSNPGDVGLNVGGTPVPFATSGVVIASPGSTTGAMDNLTTPFDNGNGNTEVSVANANNGGDPVETNEPTNIGYFPYADGWLGGHFAGNGSAIGANLGGAVLARTATGNYQVSGLPGTGHLFAVSNGNHDTGGDNTLTTRNLGGGVWHVEVLDNNGTSRHDQDFSILWVNEDAAGVYTGMLDVSGVASELNAAAADLGVTASKTATGTYEILLGDGSAVHSGNAILFVTGVNESPGIENIYSASANGPAGDPWTVKSTDLPDAWQNEQDAAFRFLIVPLDTSGVYVVPEPGTALLVCAGLLGLAVKGRRRA